MTAHKADTQTRRDDGRRTEPVRHRHPAKDVYEDHETAQIADISPEGPPANASLGSKGIAKLITLSVVVVIIASVLTGLIAGASAGWGVFVVSMLLAVIINPVLYASALRARERGKVSRNAA